MRMDRLEAMRVFVSVAELSSFAAAARRLKLSAPAVTRLVAALEQHLGMRLLQRTTRAVTLTDAGRRYLERARRIVSDVAEAEDAAQTERNKPIGRFVVTAPNMFGRMYVAPLMHRYVTRYPAVSGELSLSDRNLNLVEDGIDAAIRIGVLEDSSHIARQVGSTRRVIVASPKYLARRKTLRRPDDILQHDLIQLSGVNPSPIWRFSENGGERGVTFVPRYITNSSEVAIAHAQLGGGLAMVFAYQVAEAVRAGQLRILLSDREPPALPIHVVYPAARVLSAKVRAFVDLIVKTCDWRFVEL
jgi:DNA-binding transcriptional LysR family regulator